MMWHRHDFDPRQHVLANQSPLRRRLDVTSQEQPVVPCFDQQDTRRVITLSRSIDFGVQNPENNAIPPPTHAAGARSRLSTDTRNGFARQHFIDS